MPCDTLHLMRRVLTEE